MANQPLEWFCDGNGSLCVQWEQAFGQKKRAWIQRRKNPDKDWAKTPEGRYLNIVRVDKATGNPRGNSADFPIFGNLPDRPILEAFVLTICAVSGLAVLTGSE